MPVGGAHPPAPAHASAADTAVIIYLRAQPFMEEAARRRAEFDAQHAAALARVRAESVPAPASSGPPLPYAEEIARAAAAPALDAAGEARQAQALAALDQLLADQRRAVYAAAGPAAAGSQRPVEALVRALGGVVTVRLRVVNALAARVPAAAVPALARHPAVAEVVPDTLAAGALDYGPASLHAETFWNAGYTGGALDLAVIDTGTVITHPALLGHNFLQATFLATGSGFTTDLTPFDINGHGTHVAGIAGSRDPALRGVAFGFDTLLNAKAGYDTDGTPGGNSAMWESDSMAAAEWALFTAADSAEAINLSFASCANSADDTNWARFFDALVNATGVTVAVAAGNSGPCTRVASPSLAYNVISVANVNDQNTLDRADDVLDPTSLLGPTVNGRRKPDLAAPGTNISSTNAAWDTQPDFKTLTGTSMAAPHAAGAALLLMQAGLTDPRAIKALLINTAEDKGAPGWDAGYGWGYLDLAHAYAHRDGTFLGSVSPLTPSQLYAGPTLPGDRATLAWHRHVNYPCAPTCPATISVTNLNLELYQAATNSLLSASTTPTDTVEQVTAPATSTQAVLRVNLASLSGFLTHEDYALAAEEGFAPAAGPLLADASTGAVAPVGEPRPVTVRVTNAGDLPAHNVTLTITVPSGVGLSAGTSVHTVGMLAPGAAYTVPYTATLQQDSARFFGVAATGLSYGLSQAVSDTVGVHPEHTRLWLQPVFRVP